MIISIISAIILSVAIIFIVVRFVLPDVTKKMIDQFLTVAKEQLGSQSKEIKTDYENKRLAIETLIKQIKVELDESGEKLTTAEKERIGSFHALKKELENQRKITEQLSTTTESLKKVLSNNQLRGQFGEQVAEELLTMSGFVRGVDFEFNKEQQSGNRPDFTIFLPNKVKINVDAKFPYQNLQRMTETKDEGSKRELMKAFERDIREKIKQVTTRDYINPEDNTVDFVILFIPNEMIFSFIYDKMNAVWLEAMRQKVVFAGPFSFTAVLRLVRQAYDNFLYQKNVQKIIESIKIFENEFIKYNQEFVKIGDRIDSLSKQYNDVNRTRTNQLVKSLDNVKLENADKVEDKLLT
jgi:DNA recombination protein RmuC